MTLTRRRRGLRRVPSPHLAKPTRVSAPQGVESSHLPTAPTWPALALTGMGTVVWKKKVLEVGKPSQARYMSPHVLHTILLKS